MIDYDAFKKEQLLPPSSSKSIVEDLKPKVVAEIAKPVSSQVRPVFEAKNDQVVRKQEIAKPRVREI